MEDKTFELIEKLYNRMEEGFKEIRTDMNDGFQRVDLNMTRMEQKFDDHEVKLKIVK